MTRFSFPKPVSRPLLSAAAAISANSAAQAAYVVNIGQSGSDVVAYGSGSLDLTDLRPYTTVRSSADIYASDGHFATSAQADVMLLYYNYLVDPALQIKGPASFGPGSHHTATSFSGDSVLIGAGGESPQIAVQRPYQNGDPLSSTTIWANSSLAELGLDLGSYLWTWGGGEHADSFTINIMPTVASVPEPASWAMLVAGFGLIGATLRQRRGALRVA